MSEFGGIYTSNVCVFRGKEEDGYPFLPQPLNVSFIAVAAYNNKEVNVTRDSKEMRTSIAVKSKRKIDTIFQIGLLEGHDSLVLSAWGCGAFGNPPEDMAQLFACAAQQYAGYYKKIVFAIIPPSKSGAHSFVRCFDN
jgi:uncharacterized protein (TIGR02452 family)